MKAARYGETDIRFRRSPRGWYVMVGRYAVCAFHGAAHLHAHSDQAHPDHHRRVPLDPALSLAEALRRIRPLCESLPREPTLAELEEALR